MKKYKIINDSKTFLGDIYTPVQVFANLRELYPDSLLLESSDYNSKENSRSIICCNPIADFIVMDQEITTRFPLQKSTTQKFEGHQIYDELEKFTQNFTCEGNQEINGLFGYLSYDSIPYFEQIHFTADKKEVHQIPEIRFHLYRFIAIFDHFHNTIEIIENRPEGDSNRLLRQFEAQLINRNFQTFPFEKIGEPSSNITDERYLEMVAEGKDACRRGDVFQIVLSRQFQQKFKGDELTLYRALRSVNPSPYLFFYDYTDYKVFGSSPEAQIIVNKEEVEIHPIAGTFRRTGNDKADKELAVKLKADKKETAEHIMLVDLARNDLSRNVKNVKVEDFKEIQYFSHVIHMVSKVTGEVAPGTNRMKIMMDSFPAGTLSGAPKYKAMELIDQIENQARGLYAGAIGYIGFNGLINLAIVIRSFVSKKNVLYYQAGAGIVHLSEEESELKEVNNKLNGLTKAIEIAQNIYQA